ncbi:MAG: NAD(+) diphosphatase [Nocardioides sp.]
MTTFHGRSESGPTLPHLRIAADPHDRQSVRRSDSAWLSERWHDPRTRVLVVADGKIRPRDGAVDWLAPDELPVAAGEAPRLLLGERDGRAWFAVLLARTPAGDDQHAWSGLRDLLLGGLANLRGEAPLVFHAVGLAEWYRVTRHCPSCGGALKPRAAGHELICGDCGRVQFPRTDPAVIMAITDGEPGAASERLLLGRQQSWPAGRFSTLAGFVEPGESLEDAVRREVFEEVGVRVGEVAYFGNQAWPFPSSLMLGLTGRAETTDLNIDNEEISEARWFTRAELLEASRRRSVLIPRGFSISSSLVQHWVGEALPATW